MIAIDCHCHIYHPRMAAKAVESVGNFYEHDMSCSGTSQELVNIASQTKVRHFVINAVALNARAVRKLNDFIAGECKSHPEFTGLGTLHPDMENAAEEIERIISLGLAGIKLHPDSQQFDMDSDKAMKIYELIEGRLPVLIHCGDHRYDSSHPRRLANILDAFPKLTVVAGHLGGWSIFEEAVPYVKDRHCYMDISSTMPFIGTEKTLEYIKMYGADRIMFGSDYPMFSPVAEYDSFMSMPLSDEEREKILWKNAADVFGIDRSI